MAIIMAIPPPTRVSCWALDIVLFYRIKSRDEPFSPVLHEPDTGEEGRNFNKTSNGVVEKEITSKEYTTGGGLVRKG